MYSINNLPLVAAALIFFVIILLFVATLNYAKNRRDRLRLIDKIRSETVAYAVGGATVPSLSVQMAIGPFSKFLASIGKRFQPEKSKAEFKQRSLQLQRAGIRWSNALAVFGGIKFALAFCFAGVFVATKPVFFRSLIASKAMLISLALAFFGYLLPDLWLRLRIAGRKRRIQDGLPDALDLLVVCVEAGMGLDAALSRVGEEIRLQNKELSQELTLMNFEIRAGKLRRDAMKNLALRTELEDVNSLVTMLIQTDKFGTSVGQALRVYSDTFRTKRAQRAEEIASRLPVKLVLPLALCILPSIFIVTMGPAIISIFRLLIQKH